MKFGIYSRYLVDDIIPTNEKTVLIRIFSNYSDFFDMKYIDLYSNVLELCIEDFCVKNVEDKLRDKFIELNRFILFNDFEEIIVHCTLGISRSPAIMICIAKILDSLDMENIIKENFKFYNKIIVDEFEKFDYLTKNVKIDDIVFRGHKSSCDYCYFDIINSNKDVYSLVLKK